MARLFRHRYSVLNKRTGNRETRITRNWYIEYRNAEGKRIRVPGYRDRLATERKAAELEVAVVRRMRGQRDLPDSPADRPLADHLADYVRHLESKGDTPRHVASTRFRVKRILDSISAVYIDQLRRGAVETWLASKRHAGTFSASTSNAYLRALKAFVRWMDDDERLTHRNPVAGLKIINADTDRRRVRRALSDAEFAKLIAATQAGKPMGGRWSGNLTGPDRAMLYQLAAYSGLRRSELLSLTPASFDLKGKPPTVTVEAVSSKRRRRDVLPLPVWFAAELRTWLRGRGDGLLWSVGRWLKTARMLARDLKAAKIPQVDATGRVYDFHALRSQYITGMARAGVPLVTAQKLARHSDPKLTSQFYTHLEMDELGEQVEKIKRPKPK